MPFQVDEKVKPFQPEEPLQAKPFDRFAAMRATVDNPLRQIEEDNEIRLVVGEPPGIFGRIKDVIGENTPFFQPDISFRTGDRRYFEQSRLALLAKAGLDVARGGVRVLADRMSGLSLNTLDIAANAFDKTILDSEEPVNTLAELADKITRLEKSEGRTAEAVRKSAALTGGFAKFLGRLKTVGRFLPQTQGAVADIARTGLQFGTAETFAQIAKKITDDPTFEGGEAAFRSFVIGALFETAAKGVQAGFRLLKPTEQAAALKALGLKKGATEAEIRKAAQVLAKKFHPDKVAGQVDKFKSVIQSRDVALAQARGEDIVQAVRRRGLQLPGEVSPQAPPVQPARLPVGKRPPIRPKVPPVETGAIVEAKTLYHGTSAEFEKFDITKAGTVQKGDWGTGIYLESSKAGADYYRVEAVKRTDPKLQELHEEYREMERNLPPKSDVDSTPKYDEKTITKLRELQDYAAQLDKTEKGRVVEVKLAPDAKIYKHNTVDGITDPFLAENVKAKGYDVLLIDEGRYTEEYVVLNPEVLAPTPTAAPGAIEGATDSSYEKFFRALSKKFAAQEKVETVFEVLGEAKANPIEINDKFWQETYDKLDPAKKALIDETVDSLLATNQTIKEKGLALPNAYEMSTINDIDSGGIAKLIAMEHLANEVLAPAPSEAIREVPVSERIAEIKAAVPEAEISRAPIVEDGKKFHPVILPTKDIDVDPATFQYKLGAKLAGGVTDALKGVKTYKPTRAEEILVWQEKDGKIWVVDGHHRHRIAVNTGQPTESTWLIREVDGWTKADARVEGALRNLANGKGTAIDAAKLFRESDMTHEKLDEHAIPANSQIVQQGMDMKNLSDEVFRMVIDERIPPAMAAVIGKHVKGGTQQRQVADMVLHGEVNSVRQAEFLALTIDSAPVLTTQEQTLFGVETTEKSLFAERAKVLDNVEKKLRTNKKVFGILATQTGIIEAKGNILAKIENLAAKEQAEEVLYMLEKLVNARGPIAEALNNATKEYAENPTKENLSKVTTRLLGEWTEGTARLRIPDSEGVQPLPLERARIAVEPKAVPDTVTIPEKTGKLREDVEAFFGEENINYRATPISFQLVKLKNGDVYEAVNLPEWSQGGVEAIYQKEVPAVEPFQPEPEKVPKGKDVIPLTDKEVHDLLNESLNENEYKMFLQDELQARTTSGPKGDEAAMRAFDTETSVMFERGYVLDETNNQWVRTSVKKRAEIDKAAAERIKKRQEPPKQRVEPEKKLKRRNRPMQFESFSGDKSIVVKSYLEYKGYRIAKDPAGGFNVVDQDKKSISIMAGQSGAIRKIDQIVEGQPAEKISPRPLVDPKATALQQDAQLRKQQEWDKKFKKGFIDVRPLAQTHKVFMNIIEPSKAVEIKHGKATYAAVIKGTHRADVAMIEFNEMELDNADRSLGEMAKKLATYPKKVLEDLMLARGHPKSREAIMLQNEALKDLAREAPELVGIRKMIQQVGDENYAKLQDLVGEDVNYVKDYFYGIYKEPQEEIERRLAKHYKTTKKFTKKKYYTIYAEARAAGLNIRDPNPINNLRSEYMAIARLEGMIDLKNSLMQTGKGVYIDEWGEAPIEWQQIHDPVFAGLAAEPELARMINNLISTNKITQSKFLNPLRQANNLLRTTKFLGSAFHLMVIAKQSLADTGYLGFLKPWKYVTYKKMPGQKRRRLMKGTAALGFTRGFRKGDPIFKEDWYRKYIGLGGGHRYSIESEAQRMFSDAIRRLNKSGQLTLKGIGLPFRVPVGFVEWMFQSYIPKVKAMKYLYTVLEQEQKLGRSLTDAEHIDIIKEGQNLFGMMNERLFGRSGTITTALRIPYMSPGYAEGNYRTRTKALLQWGQGESLDAHRSRSNIVNSFLISLIAATVGTLALTGKWPKKPERLDDVRDLFKVDTGFLDRRGKKIMIDMLTYDKDYWTFFGNLGTGQPGKWLKEDWNRMGGMTSTTFDIATDILMMGQGKAVYSWKEERIIEITDPFLQKVLKLSIHELKKMEPISVNVFQQALNRDLNMTLAAVTALAGVRLTKTEADKREQEVLTRIFSLYDQQERLDYYLGTMKNPRAAVENYNKTVMDILNSKMITPALKAKYEPKLIIDIDKRLQNKAYYLSSQARTPDQIRKATAYLKNFGVSPAEAQELWKQHGARERKKTYVSPLERDPVLGRGRKLRRLQERMAE